MKQEIKIGLSRRRFVVKRQFVRSRMEQEFLSAAYELILPSRIISFTSDEQNNKSTFHVAVGGGIQ